MITYFSTTLKKTCCPSNMHPSEEAILANEPQREACQGRKNIFGDSKFLNLK